MALNSPLATQRRAEASAILTPELAMEGAISDNNIPLQKAITMANSEMSKTGSTCPTCFATLTMKFYRRMRRNENA